MYPKTEGFMMPAEWEPHQRTFLSWPVKSSMYYPELYSFTCNAYYTELVKAIAEFEPVTVIINPGEEEPLRCLFDRKNIDFMVIPHDDAWIRDNGPTFVIDNYGNIAGINWMFNAWGGLINHKYDLDNLVASNILDQLGIRRFDAPFILEGGSIHTDGEGTLLTTEECLLCANRNPDLTKEQIEQNLKQYLNIEKIIWLKRGLSGDETNGHVDNVACFASPGKVIMQICHDPDDENYEITHNNLRTLQETTDAKGRKLDIVLIEQPPRAEFKGIRLTLSYINFYFVNGGIILPVFGGEAEETDAKAVRVLSETFPDRKIRTVDGMAIIKEGGNVHCTTQQMPMPRVGGFLRPDPKILVMDGVIG